MEKVTDAFQKVDKSKGSSINDTGSLDADMAEKITDLLKDFKVKAGTQGTNE